MRTVLGLLVALLVLTACDTAATFDITPLTGVYAGAQTVGVLAVDPETRPATIRVTANEAARTVRFTLAVDGSRPVVVPGTYTDTGIITAGNTTEASSLGIEFVVDPSGAIRGAYETSVMDSVRTAVAGQVEGTLTAQAFLLTLVEPEAGGVRTEVRAFR